MPLPFSRVRSLTDARIGYTPYRPNLDSPADRRRFAWYATHRGLTFEHAQPGAKLDLVVVTATADLPLWRREPRASKIVFELIDSYLAIPRFDMQALGRGIAKHIAGETSRLAPSYRTALVRMCRRADAVVCTTREQQAHIQGLCPNVHVVLDHHDEVTTQVKEDYSLRTPPTIVWEGLPYTIGALRDLAPVINALHTRQRICLRVLTDPVYYRYARRFRRTEIVPMLRSTFNAVEFVAWDRSTLASEVTSSDIAVIPARLTDPLSAGKPENKLLLFWRMGMPTVTAATPAYRRAMREAGLDLTSETHPEWISRLEELLASEPARQTAGKLGLHFATSAQSTDLLIRRWDDVFRSIGFSVPVP